MMASAGAQGHPPPARRPLPWSRQERHQGPWDVLLAEKTDADTAFTALSSLWASRTSLRTFSSQQARALVSALTLSLPWEPANPIRASTAHLALGLLARCALGMRPVSAGQPTPLQQELRQGLATLLRLLHDHRQSQQRQGQASAPLWVPPLVAAGALLFIGAAYPACDVAIRRTSTQVAADLLLLPGLLGDMAAAEDACAGAGLLLEHLASEDPDSSEQLASCLLSAGASLVSPQLPPTHELNGAGGSYMGETASLLEKCHLHSQAQSIMAAACQVGAVFKQLGASVSSQLAAGQEQVPSSVARATGSRPPDKAAAAAQTRRSAAHIQTLQRVCTVLEQCVLSWVSGQQRAPVLAHAVVSAIQQQQQPLLSAMATVTALVTTPLLGAVAGLGMGASRPAVPSSSGINTSTTVSSAAAQEALGACSLVAAAALMEGLQGTSAPRQQQQQHRQHPHPPTSHHQALHASVAQLAASMQVGLAYAATHYAASPQLPTIISDAPGGPGIRPSPGPSQSPGAVAQLVWQWAAGLVYARLVCTPVLAPCLAASLPPGPVAARLPLLATSTLLGCALGLDTLALHAVAAGSLPNTAPGNSPERSAPASASHGVAARPHVQHAASSAGAGGHSPVPSPQAVAALQAANEYLQRHCGQGGGLYQEVALLGRCLVQALLTPSSGGTPTSPITTGHHVSSSRGGPKAQEHHMHPQAGQLPPAAGGRLTAPALHPSQYALLEALHRAAVQAGALYSVIALHAPPGWVDGLNPELLRGLLDRIYVSIATPLAMLDQAQQAAASRQQDPHHTRPGGAPPHSELRSTSAAGHVASPAAATATPGGSAVAVAGVMDSSADSAAAAAAAAAGAGTALSLMCLAELSFCRVNLPLFNTLIEHLVTATLASPLAAAALLSHLPCYDALLQPAPQHRSAHVQHHPPTPVPSQEPSHSELVHVHQEEGPAPRWKADPVLAAKLAFLLPTAAACVAHVGDPGASAQALLPTLFLLLRHPQPGVSSVAHTAFGTIITTLLQPDATPPFTLPPQPPPAQDTHRQHEQGTSAQAQLAVATHAIPYYVERSLQLPWDAEQQLAGFESGLTMALSALPPGSPVALAAMEYVVEAGVAWLHAQAVRFGMSSHHSSGSDQRQQSYLDFKALQNKAAGQRLPGGPATPAPPAIGDGLQHLGATPDLAATQLLSICCSLVLRADWQLLPAVLGLEERLLAAAAECSAVEARHHAQAERALISASTSPTPVETPLRRWGLGASWLGRWWSGNHASGHHQPPGSSSSQGRLTDPLSQVCQHLHDLIIGSDDYVRKGLLVSWLQGVLVATSSRRHARQGPLQVHSEDDQHMQSEGTGVTRAWNRLGAVAHHIVPHSTSRLPLNSNQEMHGVSIECFFE